MLLLLAGRAGEDQLLGLLPAVAWRAGAALPVAVSPERLLCLTLLCRLICLQRSHVTRFHTLKSVVCKACGKESRPIVSRRHWRPHHAGGSWPLGPACSSEAGAVGGSSRAAEWLGSGPAGESLQRPRVQRAEGPALGLRLLSRRP